MDTKARNRALAGLVCAACIGCAGDTADVRDPAPVEPATIREWTFEPALLFPADGSLVRPEDGVALPDGRLLVADEVYGLRLVEKDGSSAPFGEFAGAGYRHEPPEHGGGANGVAFEPGGEHVLVADIHHGGIFRVEVATGATEKIWQHPHGVNTAVRDSRGTIWFTRSALNTPEDGGGRMWAAVDRPLEEGAVFRLRTENGRPVGEAEAMVEGLRFANGIVIDEDAGFLYVAETMAGRVLRYRFDADAGDLSDRTVFAECSSPDNLELDDAGGLWIAAPLTNEVVVVDTATAETRSVFREMTPEQEQAAAEFARRGEAGEPRMDLLGPDAWAPLPAFATGLIVTPADGPVYVTGLGNALVRLHRSKLEEFATRYAAAWSGGDPDALASFYAEGGSLIVNDGDPSVGREAIVATAREFMEAYPDMVVALDRVVATGDGATFHWIWTGTNSGPGGTGRAVHVTGYEEWTFDADGKIKESRGNFDEAEYRRQVAGE